MYGSGNVKVALVTGWPFLSRILTTQSSHAGSAGVGFALTMTKVNAPLSPALLSPAAMLSGEYFELHTGPASASGAAPASSLIVTSAVPASVQSDGGAVVGAATVCAPAMRPITTQVAGVLS